MQCPECKSTHIRKNGFNKQGKQNHICVTCNRQFIDKYEKQKGYDEKTKQECLTAYVNGMGFRGIERLKGVHHNDYNLLGKICGKIITRSL
jgi:transposase-like protein